MSLGETRASQSTPSCEYGTNAIICGILYTKVPLVDVLPSLTLAPNKFVTVQQVFTNIHISCQSFVIRPAVDDLMLHLQHTSQVK